MAYTSKKIMGVRRSAIVETIGFLVFISALSFIFGDGTRFYAYSPHPFWIILLLVVVQYGTNEALMCTVLMTTCLYAYNLPVHDISLSLYDYWLSITWRPIMWLLTSIIIGGLRTRSYSIESELHEEVDELERRSEAIAHSYTKLEQINETLERRLAGEVGSAIKIYEAAKSLEFVEAANRIEGINEIIISIMDPEKFSFYTLQNNTLEQMATTGWNHDEGFKTTFSADTSLFKHIVMKKQVLCVINEHDEKALDEEGILAGPLIDLASGEILGMLKFEEYGFNKLNLRNIHMFQILCEWIGMSMSNMNKMDQAEADSIIDHKHKLYTYNFLKEQIEFLTALSIRMDFCLTKLNVKLVNAEQLSEEERTQTILNMGDAIRFALRKVDQFFDEENKGEEFAILLPGTGDDNTNDVVIEKIKGALVQNSKQVKKAKYSFTIQPLHTSKNCLAKKEQAE